MSAVVFDGRAFAYKREAELKKVMGKLGFIPRLTSIVFEEDPGSQLYTQLKMQAAVRVGIEFDRVDVSFANDFSIVRRHIRQACERADVHGVLVQKPAKKIWFDHNRSQSGAPVKFEDWWKIIASEIRTDKDVDCLSQGNLHKVYQGGGKILPATVKAVLTILKIALGEKLEQNLVGKGVVVIGRSDIVGRPLAAILRQKGAVVGLVGSQDDLVGMLKNADIVVSATGVEGLVKAEMVQEGVIVIDVGAPKGDVVFEEVKEKAKFITPVPGGVGPVTVISLLENLLDLILGKNK